MLVAHFLDFITYQRHPTSPNIKLQYHCCLLTCSPAGQWFSIRRNKVFIRISWKFLQGSLYLRKGNGTPLQYSCLENPTDRSLVGCSPWGHEELDSTEQLHFHFSLSCIGEGNGNPPQCSCLENPRDGGAWWASVYGVAQSQTWLKRLSSSSSSSICAHEDTLMHKHPLGNIPCESFISFCFPPTSTS